MSTPLRVLIVEDSEDDTLLLLRELGKNGYTATYERVDTPTAMQAALKQRAWDIVIADYSMPQFDALAALGLLQQSGLDLPFIIVSGVIGEETAVSAMKAGAHDYVTKDSLVRLDAAVERELRQAEVRRARHRAEDEERRLHGELEERNRQLEQRVQELTDLNALIQEHLDQRFAVVQAYRDVLGTLESLAQQTNALKDRASSQPLPDLQNDVGPDPS